MLIPGISRGDGYAFYFIDKSLKTLSHYSSDSGYTKELVINNNKFFLIKRDII